MGVRVGTGVGGEGGEAAWEGLGAGDGGEEGVLAPCGMRSTWPTRSAGPCRLFSCMMASTVELFFLAMEKRVSLG
ncbi:hypothetical protein Mgrana_00153 [Meiothermus granaticius NBRC 107808]|uniref:Uncharacterized protein n=1 Tax=Meiothermus granaticius NBRC 107808 TaxID=1227551 RepID=A0A399FB16_9DEIN|nr:hypothetical protein Mgrana_00153 [Meiothermus granaticius NBRC 107808]